MKKPTPDDKERMRRVIEEGRAARENMQRILDEVASRQRERDERERRRLWSRFLASIRLRTT